MHFAKNCFNRFDLAIRKQNLFSLFGKLPHKAVQWQLHHLSGIINSLVVVLWCHGLWLSKFSLQNTKIGVTIHILMPWFGQFRSRPDLVVAFSYVDIVVQ